MAEDREDREIELMLRESEDLNFWRLCDELSVIQAALLITGNSPSGEFRYAEDSSIKPAGYDAAKTAISK